jgi:hypothetical protein
MLNGFISSGTFYQTFTEKIDDTISNVCVCVCVCVYIYILGTEELLQLLGLSNNTYGHDDFSPKRYRLTSKFTCS